MSYAEKRDEKLRDIRERPERHRHSFGALQVCCMIDGCLDGLLLEAHEGLTGSNGGRGCDTTSGPCSCGAWH